MNDEEALRAYLADYPREMAFGAEPPEVVFDRYHVAEFLLYNDGVRLDRDRLLAHVRPARRRAAEVSTEVHHALVYDNRIAARYTLTAVMRNGNVIATEIFTVGELAADGRLQRIDQMTRTASPA